MIAIQNTLNNIEKRTQRQKEQMLIETIVKKTVDGRHKKNKRTTREERHELQSSQENIEYDIIK